MPVLASWLDYLPDGGQARDVRDQAAAKARDEAARLEAASPRVCAEALLAATGESLRAAALAKHDGGAYRRFQPAFERARHGLETEPSRRAVAGVLAYANLLLSGGAYIEGYYDRTTRDGLAREERWLELARTLPRAAEPDAADVDRVLAYAALAVGRRDLAAAFSSDEALARLVASLDAEPEPARRAFVAFVEAFPTATHGYPELGFVARAYVVHVERRGQGGIGAASTWLARTIHEGPPPAPSFEPPSAPPPAANVPAELAARVAPLLASASASANASAKVELPFTWLALHDIHALWGGRAVRIMKDGAVEVIVRSGASGSVPWRHHAALSKAGGAALEDLARRFPVRAIVTEPRAGVPDEASPSLTVLDAKGTFAVSKWANDAHPAFDAHRRWLDELAQLVAASTPAERADDWTGGFDRELTPGLAFLLASLPARRVVHTARRALLEQLAAGDPELARALAFARKALDVEERGVAEVDERHASLAVDVGLRPASVRARHARLVAPSDGAELPSWLTAFADALRPRLTTPLLQAAWNAGMAARLVAISAGLAGAVAHLRASAAPSSALLRARAEHLARALADGAAALRARLEETGLPLVIADADHVERFVRYTPDLAPTTAAGLRQLLELARDLEKALESAARSLDVPPPAKPTAPPTPEEDELFARILADPSDRDLRRQLAELAALRNDPRAQLIRLQLGVQDEDARRQAHELVRSHPAWTAPLEALGASKVQLAGGFPDEITIDAAALLANAGALFAAAPLTRLHVRAAKGRVGEVVRLAQLANVVGLDLDDQGVTDDDLVELAGSPHVGRLQQLDLRFNGVTVRGFEALAASPRLARLEMVNLDGHPDDPVDRLIFEDDAQTRARVERTEAGKALEAKYGPTRWLRRPGFPRRPTAGELLLLGSERIAWPTLDVSLIAELATQRTEPFVATSALIELAGRDAAAAAGAVRAIFAAPAWDAHVTAFALSVGALTCPDATLEAMGRLLAGACPRAALETMIEIVLEEPSLFEPPRGRELVGMLANAITRAGAASFPDQDAAARVLARARSFA